MMVFRLTAPYTDFTELTTPMLNEFIDKVIVYERRKINRYQYDQQIEIYFNFIGKVTLPEEEMESAPEAPKTLHVASNSSFAPIGDYLSAQGEEAIALPFSKVEELTGKPLCKSAYKYASYWYPAQDRPLSNTIYNAGYDVDRVDLAARSRETMHRLCCAVNRGTVQSIRADGRYFTYPASIDFFPLDSKPLFSENHCKFSSFAKCLQFHLKNHLDNIHRV